MTEVNNQDFLRKINLFQPLEDYELVEILGICITKNYPAGSQIFAEGDPASRFFIIREGEVRISKIIPGIGEEALALLRPGHFFGEMALVDESMRSAYAIANTDAVLMEIPIPELTDILKGNPNLASKFLWEFCRILSARLRATNERFYGLFAMSSFYK
jgi:CRP-like cAMP-binding protein